MLAPADTFGSSLKTALGQINAIDKITSKENVAHAIRSVALPRQSAGPILEYHAPDISVSLGPFNTFGSAFRTLHLAQGKHLAALSGVHSAKSMR
jgi:hypothetical protein